MTRLMRVLYGALAAVFTLAAISTESFGQSVLLQGGPFTAGHQPIYSGTGSSQPIMIDGGSAAGGGVGANPSTLGITSRGTGTAPYASQGQGHLGTNFCMYDAPITNATGYHYLCLDANAQGGGLFTYGAGGGAADLTLSFIVNGITYTFPFSGSGGSCLTCITSSVSLTAGFPIIGNGSLTAALGGRSGNTTTYVTTTGAQTSGDCVSIDANGNHIASGVACAGGGGVASVSLAAPGGFSVTGSPCASTCTLAIAANGISGGIPYYSATNTMASSGALTANLPVIGGGAGAAPTVGTRSGNTTQFVTTTGAQTSGNCVSIDASGNHVATGTACGASSGITVGTTTIAAGTTGRFLYDNGGVVGEYAMPLPVANGGTGISGGTSGGIPYFSATTTIASSGALTANLPVIGGGAGSAPTVGSRSGNTTAFVTTTGTQTSGNCVSIDASGNHVANGAACAVSGALPSLSNGSIWVGDGTNTAVAVTISGDITMTNAGVTAIGATKVTNAMLAGSIAASKLIGTDIATVGTITTGTWNAGAVSVAGAITGTSSSASALAVGPNGATNPTLQIDASIGAATGRTGVKITAAAAAGGVALAAISSGTNEALSINAKGSSGIGIGSVSTGDVSIGNTSGGQVRINGAAGSVALRFVNDNLTGLGSRAALEFNAYANSTEVMRWAQTNITAFSTLTAASTLVSNVTRTIASANLQAGTSSWADVNTQASTTTLSGSTNISSFVLAKNQFEVPVLTASAAAVAITSAINVYIAGAPTTSSSGGFTPTITNPYAFYVASGLSFFGGGVSTNNTNNGYGFFVSHSPTITSAATVTWQSFAVSSTLTLTGTTTVSNDTAMAVFGQPLITDASAVTVSKASTVYIAGEPVGGGSATVTAAGVFALKIASGNVSHAASSYINFGNTSGTTGYGVRDNAGTIEIKNSGGSWAAPSGSTLTIGSTAIASGTTKRLLWDNGAVLAESTNIYTDGTVLNMGSSTNFSFGLTTATWQLNGTSSGTVQAGIGGYSASSGGTINNAGQFAFYRSTSGTIGTATVVAQDDALGTIRWFGAQQTGTIATQTVAASIRAEVDGVVTSGAGADMPGRLILSTTPDGSGTVTDSLKIDNAGNWFMLLAGSTDSGKTTNTVCRDTTTGQLYRGSGTAGICVGTSSARFKENIADIDIGSGLSAIAQIKPRTFSFKGGFGDDGARQQLGFIAEEVFPILPQLVGIDTMGRPQTVDYMGFTPLMVRAIQQLKAENDDLRAKVDALEKVSRQ